MNESVRNRNVHSTDYQESRGLQDRRSDYHHEGRQEGLHRDFRHHDEHILHRYQNPPHRQNVNMAGAGNRQIYQHRHRERNRQTRCDSIQTRGRSNREIFLRRERNSQQGQGHPPSGTKGPVPDFVISKISPLMPDGVYSFSVTMR